MKFLAYLSAIVTTLLVLAIFIMAIAAVWSGEDRWAATAGILGFGLVGSWVPAASYWGDRL